MTDDVVICENGSVTHPVEGTNFSMSEVLLTPEEAAKAKLDWKVMEFRREQGLPE